MQQHQFRIVTVRGDLFSFLEPIEVCHVCGAYGKALPKHCPGRFMTYEELLGAHQINDVLKLNDLEILS